MVTRKLLPVLISFLALIQVTETGFAQQVVAGSVHPNAVKLEYDQFLFIANGAIGIKKGDKYALVNTKGEFLVPWGKYIFSHSDLEVNKYGLIKVKNQQPIQADTDPYRVGYIDTKGKVVIPINYAFNQFFGRFDEFGIGTVGEIYKTPATNVLHKQMPYSQRKIAINLKGEKINHFNAENGVPLYKQAFGGTSMIDFKADPNHIPVIDRDKKFGLIDMQGNRKSVFVDENKYVIVRPYSEGFAAAQRPDEFGELKWGYLNSEGKEAIPFRFTIEPGPFSSGLALVQPVKRNEFNYAYIDKTGAIKFTIQESLKPKPFGISNREIPSEAGYFIKGYAYWVDDKTKRIIIYKPDGTSLPLESFIKNKEVGSSNYYLGINPQGRVLVEVGNTTGELSADGTIILPAIFNYLTTDNFADFYYTHYNNREKKKTEGIIDKNGVFILIKSEAGTTTW